MVKPNSDWKDDDSTTRSDLTRPERHISNHRDGDETLAGGTDDTPLDLTQAQVSASDIDGDQTRPPKDDVNIASTFHGPNRTEAEAVTAAGALDIPSSGADASLGDDSQRTGAGVDTIVPGAPGEGPLAPGHAFGSRYHIVSVIGVGGMGAVYRAWDQELGVLVALKVIRPEVAADPEAARALERRFKQELLLARQVTHRNVVRIHDLGEVHGIKYITMPFIEGEDLSSILKREGSLPVPRLMPIARTMVSGLVAAHKAGIVHRDLKPANIMVDTEGQAMIMDFGVARSAAPAGAAASLAPGVPAAMQAAARAGQTVVGSVVGTIDYMAPEQARAQPVDQRADIYAVGLILYDLLLGRRRSEHAKSAIAELQERMQSAPPAPRTINPEVPEAIDVIVSRCLRPDPAERFQTTEDLEAALNRLDDEGKPLPVLRRLTRRMMVGVGVLIIALVGGTYWLARGPAPVVEHPPMSVLVADFDNRTGDSVFEGTVEQTLGLAIEGAKFVNLYPRADALKLAGQLKAGSRLDEQMARALSRREGIEVILAGSIEPEGTGYKVTVRAIDPGKDTAEPLDVVTASVGGKDEVLRVLGTLGARLRGTLGDTTPESARIAAAETFTTSSAEAIKSYTVAQDFLNTGKYEEAVQDFQHAIQKDPNFGRAYASMGTAQYHLGRNQEAEQSWKKAISLMDRMTEREKYRTLGTYYLAVTHNFEKAVETYSTLVKLYPSDAIGHGNLGVAYFSLLDFKRGLEETRKAVELYPRNAFFRNNYILAAMYGGEFATGVKEAEAYIKEEPGYFKNYLPIAIAAMAEGRWDAAAQAYARMDASAPGGGSYAAMGMADMAMYRGHYAEAEKLLRQGIEADRKVHNTASLGAKLIALAETYAATQRMPLALKTLDEALKLGLQETVMVPAARLYVQAGKAREATDLAADLDNSLQTQARAYAKIIDGNVALLSRRRASAIDAFRESIKLTDFWMARFDMGVTYVQAGLYPEALAELEISQKRRGEATAIFFDERPTFRYLATLPYWLARAQEGAGQRAAALANYKVFLSVRGESTTDPLVIDARRRSGT